MKQLLLYMPYANTRYKDKLKDSLNHNIYQGNLRWLNGFDFSIKEKPI